MVIKVVKPAIISVLTVVPRWVRPKSFSNMRSSFLIQYTIICLDGKEQSIRIPNKHIGNYYIYIYKYSLSWAKYFENE